MPTTLERTIFFSSLVEQMPTANEKTLTSAGNFAKEGGHVHEPPNNLAKWPARATKSADCAQSLNPTVPIKSARANEENALAFPMCTGSKPLFFFKKTSTVGLLTRSQ